MRPSESLSGLNFKIAPPTRNQSCAPATPDGADVMLDMISVNYQKNAGGGGRKPGGRCSDPDSARRRRQVQCFGGRIHSPRRRRRLLHDRRESQRDRTRSRPPVLVFMVSLSRSSAPILLASCQPSHRPSRNPPPVTAISTAACSACPQASPHQIRDVGPADGRAPARSPPRLVP
jgi:hypothetical protein